MKITLDIMYLKLLDVRILKKYEKKNACICDEFCLSIPLILAVSAAAAVVVANVDMSIACTLQIVVDLYALGNYVQSEREPSLTGNNNCTHYLCAQTLRQVQVVRGEHEKQ